MYIKVPFFSAYYLYINSMPIIFAIRISKKSAQIEFKRSTRQKTLVPKLLRKILYIYAYIFYPIELLKK